MISPRATVAAKNRKAAAARKRNREAEVLRDRVISAALKFEQTGRNSGELIEATRELREAMTAGEGA